MKIKDIKAYWILDSRGNPTIEVALYTDSFYVVGSSPSGASTGMKEAIELRDNDKDFHGKGVKKAIAKVNEIKDKLIGKEFYSLKEFDSLLISLDSTPNKSNLGGNTTTALSIAFAKLLAKHKEIPLWKLFGEKKFPNPMFNIINGGKHAGNSLAIQEFMIVPSFSLPSENIKAASEIYHTLKSLISKKYGKQYTAVGDEGGFAPPIKNTEEALQFLENAIEETGYKGKVNISMDCAADSFYNKEKNTYEIDNKSLSKEELLDYYLSLSFPIFSIEDPFFETHEDMFAELKKADKFKVIGDDLTVTNINFIKEAYSNKAIDGVIIKINQVGTVSEAIKAVQFNKNNSLLNIVSHRSGDREESFIADFAVGLNAEFIKTGAPARAERTTKYNRLIRIENLE